jgi:hypothetical protein
MTTLVFFISSVDKVNAQLSPHYSARKSHVVVARLATSFVGGINPALRPRLNQAKTGK